MRGVRGASAGDSRSVLARDNGAGCIVAVQLTVDDKPELASEMERINAAGGLVGQLKDRSGACRDGPTVALHCIAQESSPVMGCVPRVDGDLPGCLLWPTGRVGHGLDSRAFTL
jgi:Protein phosphatase 2C